MRPAGACRGIARMFNALSIRKKFYGFGGLMAAVALIIGTIGYWGIARQGSELDGVVTTSLALRNHLESDMMHDALRADVLGALRAARDNNKEDLAAVKADQIGRASCRDGGESAGGDGSRKRVQKTRRAPL